MTSRESFSLPRTEVEAAVLQALESGAKARAADGFGAAFNTRPSVGIGPLAAPAVSAHDGAIPGSTGPLTHVETVRLYVLLQPSGPAVVSASSSEIADAAAPAAGTAAAAGGARVSAAASASASPAASAALSRFLSGLRVEPDVLWREQLLCADIDVYTVQQDLATNSNAGAGTGDGGVAAMSAAAGSLTLGGLI